MKIKRWNGFSVTNASLMEAKLPYIRLNRQTPCPPRGAARRAAAVLRRLIPVNQGCFRRLFHSQHPDRFRSWLRPPQLCQTKDLSNSEDRSMGKLIILVNGIPLTVKRMVFCVLLTVALCVEPGTLRARLYNVNTGRFQTMDTYEGNNEDPLSLHKYLYCHGNPVMNTDPSGHKVYVATRPLNMGFVLSLMRSVAVHVYLVFDAEGMDAGDFGIWKDKVHELNDPNRASIQGKLSWVRPHNYEDYPCLTTFSFHPKSVATGDMSENHLGVLSTPGSFVAYNDGIDHNAATRSGMGYEQRTITDNVAEQMKLYELAVKSRDDNNRGVIDPASYELGLNNCGSWAKTIVERGGLSFPLHWVNLGTGIGGPMDYTPVPYLATGLARGWNPQYDSINGGIGVFSWGLNW
jgi:hypothetical protein